MPGLGIALTASLLSLAGSEWGPVARHDVYVQFRLSGVSGNGGCNQFAGAFSQDGSHVKIGPLSAEGKVCLPEIMAGDRDWMNLLQAAVTVEATLRLLVLKDASGAVLAKLLRRDFD